MKYLPFRTARVKSAVLPSLYFKFLERLHLQFFGRLRHFNVDFYFSAAY